MSRICLRTSGAGKGDFEYPVDDGALTPGYAMYLKKIFAENQLDVAVLGCYLNLANPNPASLAKNTHRYLAHIRFASLLGAGGRHGNRSSE